MHASDCARPEIVLAVGRFELGLRRNIVDGGVNRRATRSHLVINVVQPRPCYPKYRFAVLQFDHPDGYH